MTIGIGSRTRQLINRGAICNMNRRYQNFYRQPELDCVQGTDISFTAPNTIASVAAAFGNMRVGDIIRVKYTGLNSRDFVVQTASAASITVLPAVVATEAAGSQVVISEV